VVESFRPGVLERLGGGYDALSAENPRLVYCALTGYGQDGPYRDRAGHDIDYIGLGGVLEATGPPDGPPVLPAVQVGDFGGGMAAAVAVVAGLREAAVSGRGRVLDVSMLDVAVSWTAVSLSWYLATGQVPDRGAMRLTGGLACYRAYACADGRYVAVGALEPKFWRELCERLNLPELIEDHLAPPPRQEEMAARLAAVLAGRTRDEWARELANLDVCVAPVNDVAEAIRDPQVVHRGMVAEVGGRPVGPGPAVHGGGAQAVGPAPGLGEHTEEVLSEAGFTTSEIAELRSRSVV
jgi:crotonobetainyl-CoA:carnitine CoA-transferase CaiB-like acyl-CoA transferase